MSQSTATTPSTKPATPASSSRPVSTVTSGATTATAGQQQQRQQQQQQQIPSQQQQSYHHQSNTNVTDQAVLDYLRKKGLGSAVLELTKKLEEEEKQGQMILNKKDDIEKTPRDRLEEEDAAYRNQRSLLAKSTGGNYGYDRDSAWPVVQWGVPENLTKNPNPNMGVDEARTYIDSFVTIQLWVLSLPDDVGTNVNANLGLTITDNPIRKAQQLILEKEKNNENFNKEETLKAVIEELAKPTNRMEINNNVTDDDINNVQYNLPPSAKPELLSVTFALLVHTYCEILEVGMESTAHSIRDAFKPIYEPLYGIEYKDLYQCTTTEDMMRLNSHNSQHMEALATLKQILVQVASYQLRREELKAQNTVNGESLDESQQKHKEHKISEYDRHIGALKQKYNELSQKASTAFDKMYDLPFLRRARAVRWQLTLSTTSYGLLSSFLNTHDDSLLCMSTLLQTKCELHVERRSPLPFTPACVLNERTTSSESSIMNLHQFDINWAAPTPRLKEEFINEKKIPFPKVYLDTEYTDEREARRDKRRVEFNRALLVNGFRRLEALERKREFEALSTTAQKRIKEGDQQILSSRTADPMRPSILLTTLCASSPGSPLPKQSGQSVSSNRAGGENSLLTDVSMIWDEAGIGLCCAKMCKPDGRRIAVGCDDSAVRIWSTMDKGKKDNIEPIEVLLGHKNGFPVFDVDWNRDGRSLLSAGGDGSIRLWDTMAAGPFGDTIEAAELVKKTKPKKKSPAEAAEALVPDAHTENYKYTSGAALAVYRGHAPSSPVWSVSFSPSGYYFASTGGDATARLWTTDRPIPVRLFTGHSASNVNCVEWHPNCNYIITGSDDKTARLWDIQTGRTVRLLTGCYAGVNAVQITPSGRYAAVADYSGVIHYWDLGTGKKVTEFRTKKADSRASGPSGNAMVHTLSFSACGESLATGGDDCYIRIWDVRKDSLGGKSCITSQVKNFATKQTVIMDLQYTKRNLLLAAGKSITPVPVAPSFED